VQRLSVVIATHEKISLDRSFRAMLHIGERRDSRNLRHLADLVAGQFFNSAHSRANA
jgi:hypothetical protein